MLGAHIVGLEARVKARYEAAPRQGKARGFSRGARQRKLKVLHNPG
jgi:hypothetical protein